MNKSDENLCAYVHNLHIIICGFMSRKKVAHSCVEDVPVCCRKEWLRKGQLWGREKRKNERIRKAVKVNCAQAYKILQQGCQCLPEKGGYCRQCEWSLFVLICLKAASVQRNGH